MISLLQLLLSASFLYIGSLQAQNTKIKHFGKAKSLLRNIYGNKNLTFYCKCEYQKKTIKSSCDIKTKKFKKRKRRLEWEHIVPAHAFGQSFNEWRNSKDFCAPKKSSKGKLKKLSNRKCAYKTNKLFRLMEADIYNIVPSVGAINAIRSNYSMSFIDKGEELCAGGLILLGRKVMPPKDIRGDVARVYYYMDKAYPNRGIISSKNKKLFLNWSSSDPISRQECDLYKEKKKVQLNINPILETPCQKN